MKPNITRSLVESRFYYVDGILFHKKKRITNKRSNSWNTRFSDKPCGAVNSDGYLQVCISINGKKHNYLVHRLIFSLHHGFCPVQIDHIDGDKLNNKIENLRESDSKINGRNLKLPTTNKTGYIGVSFEGRKYRARIKVDGRLLSLGSFDNISDAIVARKEANIKYGFHENHGRN